MSSSSLSRVAIGCVAVVCSASICKGQDTSNSMLSGVVSVGSWTPALHPVGVSSDTIRHTDSVVHDTFLGPDKVKHFLVSSFLEALGFGAMQLAGANRTTSLAAATAAGAAAGVGREIHDGRTKGLFSLGDLAWDALGIGSALLLVSHTQR